MSLNLHPILNQINCKGTIFKQIFFFFFTLDEQLIRLDHYVIGDFYSCSLYTWPQLPLHPQAKCTRITYIWNVLSAYHCLTRPFPGVGIQVYNNPCSFLLHNELTTTNFFIMIYHYGKLLVLTCHICVRPKTDNNLVSVVHNPVQVHLLSIMGFNLYYIHRPQ